MGIDMLEESSRDCIRVALTLYRGIIEQVERVDYRVLDGRVRVGLARRARIAGQAYFRARKHFPAYTSKTAV
jgi:phytoene synthase